MTKAFYLTTPLYYVNAAPHIGHSYTNIAADCLARYHRLRGDDVFFLTGTDEHGQKIEQAAKAAGLEPQAFVDGVVKQFESLWKLLNISNDDFIRTTQPRHIRVVQECLRRLQDKLVHKTYTGWYCTPDETYWTDDELQKLGLGANPLCPTCSRPLEYVTEDGWHLPLRGKNQDWLHRFLKAHPGFVQPSTRYNEVMSLLEQPLPEYLSITRPRQRVGWGIEVPFSPQHVTYVWVDALLNYISAVGYLEQPELFQRRWPVDVHFIGKDILRHHTLYWPILLHAMGFADDAMPRLVFAHGWWKVGEQKMSKSLGNIVDPVAVVTQMLADQPFAADVYRYFLLRDVPFGQDGVFSEEALTGRLHADLGNDLGNLVHRTLSMIERYCQGHIPSSPSVDNLDVVGGQRALADAATGLVPILSAAMERIDFSSALEEVFRVVSQANQYVEIAAPWKMAKNVQAAKQLPQVLAVLAETVRIMAIALDPFMPSVAQSIWEQLGMAAAPRRLADVATWPGIRAGQRVGERRVLFPRAPSKPA